MSARSWSLILTSLVAAGSFGLGVHASSHQEGLHCVLTYGGRAMMAEATFTPNEDETQLHYVLKVHNIKNITMAHLHLGTMGEVSTPVVWLYPHSPPPKLIPRSFTGVLAEGTITAKDLIGPLRGHPLSDLIKEMEAGHTYVNVHTKDHPEGSICGQVRMNE